MIDVKITEKKHKLEAMNVDLGEYPAVGKAAAVLIWEVKTGTYDICQGLKLSLFFFYCVCLIACVLAWVCD